MFYVQAELDTGSGGEKDKQNLDTVSAEWQAHTKTASNAARKWTQANNAY